MAKWLKGITMAEAAKNPGNHHAEILGFNDPAHLRDQGVGVVGYRGYHPRLRAAVFINLVHMRDAVSPHRGTARCPLRTARNSRRQTTCFMQPSTAPWLPTNMSIFECYANSHGMPPTGSTLRTR